MHTPANWTVVSTGPARIPRIESDGIPVALMFQESAHYAALIAAAPDLLMALEDIASFDDRACHENGFGFVMRDIARAALSKALGE